MKALTAEELLNAWEQGIHQPLLQRVLMLLAVTLPDVGADGIMKCSIGQRDYHLLKLRQQLFGTELQNATHCPNCQAQVEWINSTTDFLDQADISEQEGNRHVIDIDEYRLHFRLPNSIDIDVATQLNANAQAVQLLISRCLLSVEYAGEELDVDQHQALPDAVAQQLGKQIERLDPLSDIRIQLCCPECSHQWDALFDISSFLWKEINSWAEQMLQNIHRLAAAYGWSEREILRLSPVRRQLYLGMIGQ